MRRLATAFWRSTKGQPEELMKRALIGSEPVDIPLKRSRQYQYWQHDECIKNHKVDPLDRKIRLTTPFSKTLADPDNIMKYRGPDRQVLRWLKKNLDVPIMSKDKLLSFPYSITTECT